VREASDGRNGQAAEPGGQAKPINSDKPAEKQDLVQLKFTTQAASLLNVESEHGAE